MNIVLMCGMSVALALVTIIVGIRFAPLLGMVDHPGGRKLHAKQMPVVGGMTLMAALVPMVFALPHPTGVSAWGLGCLMLFLLGWLDDVSNLGTLQRFLMHLLAGLFLVPPGLVLDHLGDIAGFGQLNLGMLAIPVTVFAVAAGINAMNMVDGVDGLLGMLTVVPLLLLIGVSQQYGLLFERDIALCLLAGVIVFLAFNFRFPWVSHVSTFMGDAGSTVVGFNLAFLLISLAVKGALPPVIGLYFVALPLLDAAGVILRRRLRGISVSTPGRDHLHHMLLDAGFSVRSTCLLLGAVALLLGSGALLAWRLGVSETAMFCFFVVMLALYVIWTRSAQSAIATMRRWSFE